MKRYAIEGLEGRAVIILRLAKKAGYLEFVDAPNGLRVGDTWEGEIDEGSEGDYAIVGGCQALVCFRRIENTWGLRLNRVEAK